MSEKWKKPKMILRFLTWLTERTLVPLIILVGELGQGLIFWRKKTHLNFESLLVYMGLKLRILELF